MVVVYCLYLRRVYFWKKVEVFKCYLKGNWNLNKILVYYNYGYYGSWYFMYRELMSFYFEELWILM